MKAVILAAGRGTRMGHLTENKPKCCLNFLGKTLLERQMDVMKSCGIKDIIVVTGFMSGKINSPDCLKIKNENYASTNMVESLFCSRSYWDDDILVSYGDILYERKVLEKIIAAESDINVVIDLNGRLYFEERFGSAFKEKIESLVMRGGTITDIGEPDPPLNRIEGQYIGLLKFSKKGLETISGIYEREKSLYYDKPWMRSKNFQNGYMTDLIQKTIDYGNPVKPVKIKGGWLEFDTESDYEKYIELYNEKKLGRYYTPEESHGKS